MLSVNALFYIQIKCFLFILGSFSMNNCLLYTCDAADEL